MEWDLKCMYPPHLDGTVAGTSCWAFGLGPLLTPTITPAGTVSGLGLGLGLGLRRGEGIRACLLGGKPRLTSKAVGMGYAGRASPRWWVDGLGLGSGLRQYPCGV